MGEPDGLHYWLNTATLDKTIEAVTFYYDFAFKHHCAPKPTYPAEINAHEMFRTGLIAMQISGVWTSMELQREDSNLNWDVSVLPHNKERGTILTSDFISISKGCKNPDLAWQLLKFLIQTGADTRCMPPYRSKDILKEYFHSTGLSDKNYYAYTNSMEYAEPVPAITDERISQIWMEEYSLIGTRVEPIKVVLKRMNKRFGELSK